MKYCIDCKHLEIGILCSRTGRIVQDPVHGKLHIGKEWAHEERQRRDYTINGFLDKLFGIVDSRCGPEAKWFEPK